MAKPPPPSPVNRVSAAQLVSTIAAAASAAEPPAARMSPPAWAVAGWPAATPAVIVTKSSLVSAMGMTPVTVRW